MQLARGRYLAFIDPDDYYPNEHALALLLQAAERSQKPICGGLFSTVDANGAIVDSFPEIIPLQTIKYEGYCSEAQTQNDYSWIRFIYKRSFIEENNITFPELRWHEDPVFLARAIETAGGCYCILDVVYRYRINHKPAIRT